MAGGDGAVTHAAGGFGQQLRALRRSATLTQAELAERAGVSVNSISELERGGSRAPRRDTVDLLADALGVTGAERETLVRLADADRLGHVGDDAVAVVGPRLYGREGDLATLLAALGPGGPRMVTLVGPGGVGKTALARAAAASLAAEGRPATWVGLEAVAEPGNLLPAIAHAVGAGESGGPLADLIARRLRGGPRLLVLDNLEHLLDAAADLAALLSAAPEVHLLATSRQAARLRGERVLPLAPLPVPAVEAPPAALAANPAVALFAARAAEASVRTVDVDLPAAARVVRLLDGLPLAIELAAAQATDLSAASLADLLALAGLRALDGGSRDGPARFATMEAAIAWSYHLLAPREQRLLQRLGVFRGGFAPAEAAAVAGADAALLPRLVQASLVRDVSPPGGAARLALLEPVRHYARQELAAAGDLEAASAAHAAAYAALATSAKAAVLGPSPEPGLAVLDLEAGNIEAMLEWLVAHDPVTACSLASGLRWWWEERGQIASGERWLERIAAVDDAADPLDRVEVRFVRAILANFRENAPSDRHWSAEVVALAEAVGTPTLRGIAALRRGEAAITVDHDPAAAVPILDEAVALLEECERPRYLMWALARRGIAKAFSGAPLAGVADFRRAVAVQEREGLAIAATSLHAQLAWALTKAGLLAEARAETAAALRLAQRFRTVPGMLLNAAGLAFFLSGDPDLAVRRTAAIVIGAAEATAEHYGFEFDPELGDQLAEALARLAIDDPEGAIAEGAATPLEAVVDLALAALEGIPGR